MFFLRKIIFIILSSIILTFSSCETDTFCNCFEDKGSETSEIREIPTFHSIEMDNNVDVVLVAGSAPQLKVICGKNLIDGIQTEVRGEILYISNVNKCNWLRDFKNKFTVEVTYTQLDFITTIGSGNLSCKDTVKSNRFQVESWNGTGKMDFILDCNEVYFKLHTGPADIFASGKAGIMYVYSAGNGFVKVAAVESENTYVTTKSTGDCEVNVSKDLEVTIEYQGDVYYTGTPQSVKTEITGTGQLIPL